MYADYPPCATAPRWHAVGVVAFVAAGVCARARGAAAAPTAYCARARVVGAPRESAEGGPALERST